MNVLHLTCLLKPTRFVRALTKQSINSQTYLHCVLTFPHSVITCFSPHQSNPKFTTYCSNALILMNHPKELGVDKTAVRGDSVRSNEAIRPVFEIHSKGPTQKNESFAIRTSLMYTTRSRNKALK